MTIVSKPDRFPTIILFPANNLKKPPPVTRPQQNLAYMAISDKNQEANEYGLSKYAYSDVYDWMYRCTDGKNDIIEPHKRITGYCYDGKWKHDDEWSEQRDVNRDFVMEKTRKLVEKGKRIAKERGWEGFRIDMRDVV